jgi:hypothetical protein
MIDLDAIKAEIARTRVLVAEIERLNAVLRDAARERFALVAWLRANGGIALANAIEQGEHRREETK